MTFEIQHHLAPLVRVFDFSFHRVSLAKQEKSFVVPFMVKVIGKYSHLSQPEWGYLKELHPTIKPCEPALVVVDSTPPFTLQQTSSQSFQACMNYACVFTSHTH